jgi:TfoX N-terminal domain
MATAGALPQIEKYGLLSSEATLDLLSINGTRREQLLACRRPESVILESREHGRFILRDQKPMRDAALAECLVGMTLPEWYRLLNGRTFMWSNEDRVETLLGARAYRGAEHLILTVDTASFAGKYESQLEVSPINSGATLYIPPKRGAFTSKISLSGQKPERLFDSTRQALMPGDPGLEELVKSSLGNTRGLSEKAMFGGWAYLLHGNLLIGARRGSLLLRVGKDNEAWANEIPGVATAIMGGRRMSGWVRATPEAYGNDALRQKLIDAALHFTGSLPGKKP